MSQFRFNQAVGNSGIITDYDTTEVAWADGRNVQFVHGRVESESGKTLIWTTSNGTPIRGAFTWTDQTLGGGMKTIICDDTHISIYSDDFGAVTDVTPVTPFASLGVKSSWTFGVCGGYLIACNGGEVLYLIPGGGMEYITGQLSEVPAAECMAVINNHLVLGNIVDNDGIPYRGRIRWSRAFTPTDFTIDRTVGGGRGDLALPSGRWSDSEEILAITSQGHTGHIYTRYNIWGIAPKEPPDTFTWDIIATGTGLLGRRAVTTEDGVDYFIGDENIYMLAGGKLTPIGEGIKDYFYSLLNLEARETSFVFLRRDLRKVYFCIPTGFDADAKPTIAFVYDLRLKNWTILDINYNGHTHDYGLVAYTYENSPWSEMEMRDIPDNIRVRDTIEGIELRDIVFNDYGEILYFSSNINDFVNGEYVRVPAYIETGDLVLSTKFTSGIDIIKHINSIIPSQQFLNTDRIVYVQVGVRDSLDQPIRWTYPAQYSTGVRKLDFRRSGKYLRLRFSSYPINQFTLNDNVWSETEEPPEFVDGGIDNTLRLEGYTVNYTYEGTR